MCDKLKIPMFPEIRLYRHGAFTEKFDGDRTAGVYYALTLILSQKFANQFKKKLFLSKNTIMFSHH